MPLSFSSSLSHLTKKIGIDLGSTRVRIWSDQDGTIIDEPSCLAVDTKTGKVVAVGQEAYEMLGRVGQQVEVQFPLITGMLVDPEAATAMIQVFLQRVLRWSFFFRPILMVSIPAELPDPEKQALTELLFSLGVREVNFIDQILAAAIGAGVPIADASGSFLLHLGGSRVEAGIISLGSIVSVHTELLAGRAWDDRIRHQLRQVAFLEVGSRTAERLKHSLGNIFSDQERELRVSGQDLIQGVPKEVVIHASQLRSVLQPLLERYTRLVKSLFEEVPPELTSDVIDKGMLLTGGLAQVGGLAPYFVSSLGVPVAVVDNPGQATIHGVIRVLENLQLFQESVGYHHQTERSG